MPDETPKPPVDETITAPEPLALPAPAPEVPHDEGAELVSQEEQDELEELIEGKRKPAEPVPPPPPAPPPVPPLGVTTSGRTPWLWYAAMGLLGLAIVASVLYVVRARRSREAPGSSGDLGGNAS